MCKSATLKTYLCERSEKNVTEFIEYIMKKFLKAEYEERRKIHEDEMQVHSTLDLVVINLLFYLDLVAILLVTKLQFI